MNSYSVPSKAGSLIESRVSSTTVEFRHDGKPIAIHQRCYSRLQKILELGVLEHKPGVSGILNFPDGGADEYLDWPLEVGMVRLEGFMNAQPLDHDG